MTLTSPNCPVAETLPREVEEKIQKIENKEHEKFKKLLTYKLSSQISEPPQCHADTFILFGSTFSKLQYPPKSYLPLIKWMHCYHHILCAY